MSILFISVRGIGFSILFLEKKKKKMATQSKPRKKETEKTQLDKAIQAEKNFQLACDMAAGFEPITSEEDRKFMKKWIFYLIL